MNNPKPLLMVSFKRVQNRVSKSRFPPLFFSFFPPSRLLGTCHPDPVTKILFFRDCRIFFPVERGFRGLGLALQFGLCSRQNSGSQFNLLNFSSFGQVLVNQTKVFFSGEQRIDHDEGPQSHQTRNHKQLCLESVSMPRFIQISLHKTFQTQEVVRFSPSFITVFEYILQSTLQHCADLALVMNINMLIVHIKGHTTHARNSCCRRETF